MQLTDLWVIVTKDVFPTFDLPAETVAQVQEMEEHLKEHPNLRNMFVSTKITLLLYYNTMLLLEVVQLTNIFFGVFPLLFSTSGQKNKQEDTKTMWMRLEPS